jgi:hypothetical protein
LLLLVPVARRLLPLPLLEASLRWLLRLLRRRLPPLLRGPCPA